MNTNDASKFPIQKGTPKKTGCFFVLPRIGLAISLGIAVLTAVSMCVNFLQGSGNYDLLGAVIVSYLCNAIGFVVFVISVLIESWSPVKSRFWTTIFILATLILVPYWLFVFGWSGNVNTWIWLRS